MLKDFTLSLELEPTENRVVQTAAIFWSHDVNTAKIYIELLRKGTPVILNKDVTVRVMMLFDDENKSEHIYTAKIEDELKGLVSITLEESMRMYVGQVTCGVYVDYQNEEKTDNGYFTFGMRRSLIDKDMPELQKLYVSDFEKALEDIKEFKVDIDKNIDEMQEHFDSRYDEAKNGIEIIENLIKDNEVAKKEDMDDLSNNINNIENALENKKNLNDDRAEISNTTESKKGTVDFANYAGQGLTGVLPIGVVIHNYTDATVSQIDNVGDGEAVIIRQAWNPNRRLDKARDYIGNGAFLQLQRAHPREEGGDPVSTKYLLDVTKDADFLWRKDTKVMLTTTKPKDNDAAFSFTSQYEHDKVIQINYKWDYRLLEIGKWGNRARITGGATMTDGLELIPINGNLTLSAGSNGQIILNAGDKPVHIIENGVTKNVQTSYVFTDSSNRRSGRFIGEMAYDANLNKPIWAKNTTGSWVDASGNEV